MADESKKDLIKLGEKPDGLTQAKPDLSANAPKLTMTQLKAIAAIIEQPSMEKAAKQAHIGRSTLYRWLSLPTFQSELERGQRAVYYSALGRLQGATGIAVKRLIEGMNVRRKTERRLAAAAVLDFASKAQEEIEFAARISMLEQTAGIVSEGGRVSITKMKESLKFSIDKEDDDK